MECLKSLRCALYIRCALSIEKYGNLNVKLIKCQYLRRTINTILYTVYLLLAHLVSLPVLHTRTVRCVSDESVEKIRTQLLFFFYRKSFRLWINEEKYRRDGQATDNTIWRMRITSWISKDTNTHSEYVIPIAFPRQQWLHFRSPLLRYTV
jgi:hypothetical protein